MGKAQKQRPCPNSPIGENQIVKENGQCKWFGNQK
jgi:hypothetical protein